MGMKKLGERDSFRFVTLRCKATVRFNIHARRAVYVLRCVRVTIVALGKAVLHIQCVCL